MSDGSHIVVENVDLDALEEDLIEQAANVVWRSAVGLQAVPREREGAPQRGLDGREVRPRRLDPSLDVCELSNDLGLFAPEQIDRHGALEVGVEEAPSAEFEAAAFFGEVSAKVDDVTRLRVQFNEEPGFE